MGKFRIVLMCLAVILCGLFTTTVFGEAYLDNQTIYPNTDPNNETRRSDHFRLCFGHHNRDTGTPVTEQLAQGNLQMFENLWQRNIVELGLNDMGQSADLTKRDGNKYRTNFLFLMTWNDGGGGGAYMSMDGNGFSYAMANSGYCRYDPPSGATPHEIGHAWEGQARGFNGSNSSGAWWECTANWFQLQLLNSYPTDGIIWNGMYYPCHGRDYYGCFTIWETFREDPRYGPAFINQVWTNATADQMTNEYIIERMARLDSSGSADKIGASRDMWGDMAKKRVTWDFERQKWFAQENRAESDPNYWEWYQRCRTPMVKMAGTTSWYRPERSHIPMEYGFNIIPLNCTASTTVSCDFEPYCDPVRQSDWRACLVAVNTNGEARYSTLWNNGVNSITLSTDETKLYLVVTATPKPMPPNVWNAYRLDAGLQFPYAVSFTNASPTNVTYTAFTGTHTHHANGGGLVQNGGNVASTAYVGPNAQVLDGAQVKGYARIEDYAVVRNSAVVEDNAVISGHAVVQDTAHVYGNAKVRDWARVFGNAQVYENGKVTEHANCGDSGNEVYGGAVVKGTTYVYSPSKFNGCIIVDGDTANGNGDPANGGVVADHGVHFGWQWGQNTSIFSQLADNGYVYEQHTFERENPVFAWDEYGINQGFLINGCRAAKDTASPTRGGLVLPLNGTNQYVELHNSINDFREAAYTVWVKWTGSANDQRIWSMGDGASKVMYLTPKDATTGKLRFVISNGTTTQYLDGTAVLPANTWTHIAVTFGSPVFDTGTSSWSATGTLYVNGTQVASASGMLTPDALNAPLMENANYIGRSNSGNYFQGYIDDFRGYMKTLSSAEVSAIYSTAAPGAVTVTADTTAPTPNAETWLVNPNAISDSAITMSATPGTDASGWIEYYFTCTSGGGHDSGWISMNKYTDVGLTPGTTYTYTAKMRDKNGNTTTASAAMSATTQVSTAPTASFAYGPVGISDTQVVMTATKQSSPSGLVEYKFEMALPFPPYSIVRSTGWQSSPTYTDTITAGANCYYRVSVRDGRGNVSAASSLVKATAKDQAAPKLPGYSAGHWGMMPYATIDNKVSMTATDATDPAGVQYYFHCTSGNAPDSGWINSPTYVTAALADGSYSFQYKVRDKSAQLNESGYSTTYTATIKPTTGYHTYTLSQLSALPDDYLVTFTGTVMKVNANNYVVKTLDNGATITVRPNTYGEATDSALVFKNVTVNGHLYTVSGSRVVTYATVTQSGSAGGYAISGRVTDTQGAGIAGARVYISDTTGVIANPVTSVTADSQGYYSITAPNGTWYAAAGAASYYPSSEQTVVINNAPQPGINFTLSIMPKISGKVTNSGGSNVAGALVCFSKTANATVNPTYTTTTDSSGNYSLGVDGSTTWYVSVKASGYGVPADSVVPLGTTNVSGINFVVTYGGDGLKGEYFDNNDLTNLKFSKVDSQVNYSWSNTSPDPSIDSNDFSVRWSGMVKPRYSETYTFYTRSDDGVRLWVDGVLLIDNWTVHGDTENSGTITLSANRWYSIKLEYYQGGGTSVIRLDWASPSQSREVIPQSRLWSMWQARYNVSGKVTNATTGLGFAGATVSFSDTANATANPAFVVTTDTSGNYTVSLPESIWYAAASSAGYMTTADRQITLSGTNQSGVNFTLELPPVYTITASAGPNGSISPSGPVSVIHGSDQTFSITPNAGYGVSGVTVDGVNLGAITSYTFTNVTANHTIAAAFSAYVGPTPLAFYQFENNVLDTIGTNNGTPYNNPTYAPGRMGNALQLNGTNQYVTIPRSISGNWTISFFVKSTMTSRTGTQWYSGSGLVDGEVGGSTNDFGISYLNSKVAFGVGNSDTTAQSTSLINTGNWVHVACSRDSASGQMKVYINGILETTKTGPTGTKTSPPTLHIGNLQTNINYFNGAIDHLKIFNSVLNSTDVAVLAAEGTLYTITASAGTGGSITPSGAVSVVYGSDQVFTINANPGYVISDVVVDGVSKGAISSHTFTYVAANHTISAAFIPAAKPYGMNNKAALTNTVNGKRVRVWGKVKQDNSSTFTISDGHGTDLVIVVNGVSRPGTITGKMAVVTGTRKNDKSIEADTLTFLP